MAKLNFKIYCSFFFILTFLQSCKSQDRFSHAKSFSNVEDCVQLEEGFFGIDDEITVDQIEYKRFLLKKNSDIIIDGYWSLRTKDTIFFIDYNSFNNECNKEKLNFFIFNNKESHYLGRSCEDEFHFPTDVLVQYDKDTLIMATKYNRFSHSVLSHDDYKPGSDALISTRIYLLNPVYGLILKEEKGEDFDPYWYNY